MELLGTIGNVPGPTAAKAQAIYDANLANSAHNPRRKRKVRSSKKKVLLYSFEHNAVWCTCRIISKT